MLLTLLQEDYQKIPGFCSMTVLPFPGSMRNPSKSQSAYILLMHLLLGRRQKCWILIYVGCGTIHWAGCAGEETWEILFFDSPQQIRALVAQRWVKWKVCSNMTALADSATHCVAPGNDLACYLGKRREKTFISSFYFVHLKHLTFCASADELFL